MNTKQEWIKRIETNIDFWNSNLMRYKKMQAGITVNGLIPDELGPVFINEQINLCLQNLNDDLKFLFEVKNWSK